MKDNLSKDINLLISKIQESYSDIKMGYIYHSDSEMIEIWHNRDDLEDQRAFRRFTGNLLDEFFFDNLVFNVFISYNEEEAEKLTKAALNHELNKALGDGILGYFSNSIIDNPTNTSFFKMVFSDDHAFNENIIIDYRDKKLFPFDYLSENNNFALAA